MSCRQGAPLQLIPSWLSLAAHRGEQKESVPQRGVNENLRQNPRDASYPVAVASGRLLPHVWQPLGRVAPAIRLLIKLFLGAHARPVTFCGTPTVAHGQAARARNPLLDKPSPLLRAVWYGLCFSVKDRRGRGAGWPHPSRPAGARRGAGGEPGRGPSAPAATPRGGSASECHTAGKSMGGEICPQTS